MHMVGYLGGDSHLYAIRSASEQPLRLGVDFPDDHRLLTLTVRHTGEVILTWGHDTSLDVDDVPIFMVGRLFDFGNGLEFITDLEQLENHDTAPLFIDRSTTHQGETPDAPHPDT